MEARLKRLDAAHEVTLAVPLFELPQRGLELLRDLHGRLSDLAHPIASHEMHFFGGTALSDVRAQIQLYGGNAEVEVTVEKCSVRFNNMPGLDQVQLFKDCVETVWESILEIFPTASAALLSIRPTLQMELADASNAGRYLTQVAGWGKEGAWDKFGRVAEHPGVSLELAHADEGWNAVFNVFRDRTSESSLVLTCVAIYMIRDEKDPNASGAMMDRFTHLEGLLEAFVDQCGLEAAKGSESKP